MDHDSADTPNSDAQSYTDAKSSSDAQSNSNAHSQSNARARHTVATNPLTYLLLALIFVLLIVPLAERVPFAEAMLRAGITVVLVLAAIATRRRMAIFASSLFIAAVVTAMNWLGMFIEHPLAIAVFCSFESLFLAAMAGLILYWVITDHRASLHSISGAVCAYLLLGLAWGMVYWGLDHLDSDVLVVGPDEEITSPDKVTAFSKMTYFSFVTMSTLGYGDMTPHTPLARTLAWMQSVVGQFYMAVLVAWLVSELSQKSQRNSAKCDEEDHGKSGD